MLLGMAGPPPTQTVLEDTHKTSRGNLIERELARPGRDLAVWLRAPIASVVGMACTRGFHGKGGGGGGPWSIVRRELERGKRLSFKRCRWHCMHIIMHMALRKQPHTFALHAGNREGRFAAVGAIAPGRSVGCGAQGTAHQQQGTARGGCHGRREQRVARRSTSVESPQPVHLG